MSGRAATEKPVTVTAACAASIAAGRKTMIRQVAAETLAQCPIGEPGDRLWVRHSRDAPREWSAASVRIRGVRLERLQEISEKDLEAEGGFWREFDEPGVTPRDAFGRWWDSVHPRPGTRWADDPLVWVVDFELV